MVIAYPFHVKHCGIEYAPNQPIMVDDASEYLAGGAVVLDSTPVNPVATDTEEKPKKRAYNRKKVNGGE